MASDDVTRLLIGWRDGDPEALDKLMPVVYEELRRLAINRLRLERPDHSLQATALVHEAFLRLVDWRSIDWRNRVHFFAVAAQMMRNILADCARRRLTDKRGGGRLKISVEEMADIPERKDEDLLALNEALTELETIDPKQCRIVELRYFGGLSIEETAEAVGVSSATVKREWNLAKAWLFRRLSNQNRDDA